MEERIKNMTFKDMLDVMTKGLERRWVKIDMDTFGDVDLNGICMGCAATNALCEMIQQPIPAEYIRDSRRHFFIKVTYNCLNGFEKAIDFLRKGNLDDYDCLCRTSCFLQKATPENINYDLPCLENNFTEKELNEYRKLRDSL